MPQISPDQIRRLRDLANGLSTSLVSWTRDEWLRELDAIEGEIEVSPASFSLTEPSTIPEEVQARLTYDQSKMVAKHRQMAETVLGFYSSATANDLAGRVLQLVTLIREITANASKPKITKVEPNKTKTKARE